MSVMAKEKTSPTPKRDATKAATQAIPVESSVSESKQPEKPNSAASSNPLPDRDFLRSGDRISLKVVDGKVDFGSVRQSSEGRVKDALRKTLEDEACRKWLGIDAITPAELDEVFSPEQAGQILDVIVKIELIFATSTTKLPVEECEGFLKWSEREHQILDKQAARVIARYVPAEWLKRIDLWIFLLSFIGFTALKFQKLNEHAVAVAKAAKKSVDDAGSSPTAAPEPKATPSPASSTEPKNGLYTVGEGGLGIG